MEGFEMLGGNRLMKKVRGNYHGEAVAKAVGCYFPFFEKNRWPTKRLRLIALFLFVVSLCSCRKKGADCRPKSLPPINKIVNNQAVGSLLYYENADLGWFNNSYAKLQAAAYYSITASTIQHFSGTKSIRFELRNTDAEVQGGTRAELTFPMATSPKRWYSFALYFPSSDYKFDPEDEVVSQWHQGGSVTSPLCLRTKSDHLFLRILGETWVDLGALNKDTWHTYIMHVNHSASSDGLIEIWRGAQKILYRNGPNAYAINSTFHLPFWKIGIYKSSWNGSQTSATSRRVLYFDEIKLGNEYASYEDMFPTASIPPDDVTDTINQATPSTRSTGNMITDFILVNSATEKDVLTIRDGDVISLSRLNLTKANIRANTTTTGSIKFQLSGQQSKTSIDSNAPYALHGDDGKGNFYYGSWNPPAVGVYSLTATPFQSDYARGSAGTSKTITFTISR
ncbi:polysaccharide lyase [Niastella sp. OAS944]|uniref:polysaccharide lyase n=1 Tax=Niastella sp. OAS944 TaxID=2664089 RepID=UPI003489CD4D|nr:hypothetical protein [Chitinophagaceae bacterium OAS944]